MHFVLVTEAGLEATEALFAAACAARGVGFSAITPGNVTAAGLGPREGPRLLYRAAVNRAAELLEKLLLGPRTFTLHDPHFICDHQPLRLKQGGLPMPPAVYVPASEPDRLRAQVEWLGGWPVVVKRAGLDSGRGVFRVHDLEGLAAALAAPGGEPRLERFIAHGRCWRVVVLGGRVLASLASRPALDDFRSNGPGAEADLDASPPPALAALAVRALELLALDFGGVDIMEDAAGGLWLCEVNFPCSFVHVERLCGVDVAGAMVDFLAARARREA